MRAFCRAKVWRRRRMKAELHRGGKKQKKKHRWTIKLWIKRRKCGGKSARTVGAIRTLAAAQTERKKKCSADAKRTMPPAVGDQRLDLRRSLQRSASVIYTYTPCIYIYKYWTHCAKRTSPDGTNHFHAARQAHLRDCACDCMAVIYKCDNRLFPCQICCHPAFHFSTNESEWVDGSVNKACKSHFEAVAIALR